MRAFVWYLITQVLLVNSLDATSCSVSQPCVSEFQTCDTTTWTCKNVIGRTCAIDGDCDVEHVICVDNTCSCDYSWYENDGVCVSFIGKTCSAWQDCVRPWSDDLRRDNLMICADGECECKPGHQIVDGHCQQILWRTCTTDADCPLENVFCQNLSSVYAYCNCDSKFTTSYTSNQCVYRVGAHCNQVSCHYETDVFCNIDNICSCNDGLMNDSHTCVQVLDRNCTADEDCGDSAAYICTSGVCTCAGGFLRGYSDSYEVCHSAFDTYCNNSTVDTPDNSECNSDNTLVCAKGYFEVDGVCVAVLGARCSRDETCQLLDHSRCGLDNVCECSEGYVAEGGICIEVLHAACDTNDDCPTRNAVCSSDVCACDTDFTEFEGRCLREACSTHVKNLPALHRRGSNYKVSTTSDQWLLDDSILKEDWYSLGIYSLSSSSNDPVVGYCGSYYPIYLQVDLTSDQINEMLASETVATAVVGDNVETLSVRLRKCGDDTHVYLTPPSTRMSAFCIERNLVFHTQNTERTYWGSNIWLGSALTFQQRDVNGQSWHFPRLVFSPMIYESYDENNYYLINWYVDNIHIVSYGPVLVNGQSYNSSVFSLTDDVIVAHGYGAGVELQCSVQVIERLNGDISGERFSNILSTGLQNTNYGYPHTINDPGSDKASPFQPQHEPIGCSSADDDDTLMCSLVFDVADIDDQSNCTNATPGTIKHPKCGLTLIGLTYKGYTDSSFNSYYSSTYNNSKRIQQTMGTLIVTSAEEEHDLSNNFKIEFKTGPDNTGHPFWDNYKPPNLYVRVGAGMFHSTGFSCNVYKQGGIDMLTATSTDFLTGNVPLEAAGEFIALHDTSYPFQIQFKIEHCTDANYGTTMCLCGVTVNDRNTIYTTSICDGHKREGIVFGEGTTITLSPDSKYNMQLYFMSGSLTVYVYAQYADNISIEGLCSAQNGHYVLRTGETSSDWTGFLESWRISDEESLLNPDNHIKHAWTEESYKCGCPESTDNVSDSVTTYQSDSYEARYAYTSGLKCSLRTLCSTGHSGIVWPESLLPNYYIEEITVSADMYIAKGRPSLTFICHFQTATGYWYNIQWFVNGEQVKSSTPLSSDEALEYHLTDEDISDHNELIFVLDAKVKCGAVLMDTETSVLVEITMSENFQAVEITHTAINMARGSDGTITLRNNLPLICEDCVLEFTLYDTDDVDSDCRNSTFAVKSTTGDICGARVHRKASSQDVVETSETIQITITTKNNNKYSLKNVFPLRLKSTVRRNGKKYFQGEFGDDITEITSRWLNILLNTRFFSPTVKTYSNTPVFRNIFSVIDIDEKVFVRDDAFWMRKLCYANNDPRMKTFDGRYWYLELNGAFVMYRHKTLPVEVQLLVMPCNGGWATCSCGVILRSGQDVYIIDHCYGDHLTTWLSTSTGEESLIVRKRSDTRYQFYFPHGTQVDVSISPWRWYLVNVNIYASPADVNNVEGLCGYFNGDSSDDFTNRNGDVEAVNHNYLWWWWYYYPTEFQSSWRLTGQWEHESLLNPLAVESLSPWQNTDILCVCPGNHESDDAICSVNEEETCTVPIDVPGVKVKHESRVERSAQRFNYDIERRLHSLRTAVLDVHRNSITKRSAENSLSEEDAMADCDNALTVNCPAFTLQVVLVKDNGSLLDCGLDSMIDAEVTWGDEYCVRSQINAENQARKDVEFQEENPDSITEINSWCVGNCSNNGECVDGKCVCFPGFANSDCIVDTRLGPVIERIQGDGICDTSTDGSCLCILIVTNGNADYVRCSITVLEAYSDNNTFVETDSYVTPGKVDNLNEVFCCVESHRRRKRSTGSQGTPLGTSLQLSLSNDNNTFSDGQFVYVLDSSCQEIQNDTDGVKLLLKSGFCFIDGICYADNSTSGDGCGVCHSSSSLFDWTDSCLASPSSNDSGDTDTTIFIAGGVTGAVALAIVVGVIVAVLVVVKKKKVIVPDLGLYDRPKMSVANTSFKMRDGPNYSAWK